MMADLAKIGTVKQWTEKFGRMFGHDASITDNVARLLTEGVKKRNEETTRAWAVAFLQAVKDEMIQESVQWLHKQQQAYDAYAAGAGPVAG